MNADEVGHVGAVAVKLPPFWADKAHVWFIQAEAQFATRNITADVTKYYHVVAALDQDVATRVLDLLQAPPANDKYATLKARLIGTFTLSETQRAAALLNIRGLGDSRPSELMDRMLALLGSHAPCFLFREIFMQQMPLDIRPHLAQADIADFRQLAQTADVLCTARCSTEINAVRVVTSRPTQRPPQRPTLTSSHAMNATATPQSDLCYYHRRFGAAAKQCRPPCTFSTSGNGQAGRQ